MDFIISRVISLFPNQLELISYCAKELYLTSFSRLISGMKDPNRALKYYNYLNYNSLEINFYHWPECERTNIHFPDFVETLKIKVSQRQDVVYCNIYINGVYVGNLYFSFPILAHVLVLIPNLVEDDREFFDTDEGNYFIKAVINLIIYAFAFVHEKDWNISVFSAIDPLFIKFS